MIISQIISLRRKCNAIGFQWNTATVIKRSQQNRSRWLHRRVTVLPHPYQAITIIVYYFENQFPNSFSFFPYRGHFTKSRRHGRGVWRETPEPSYGRIACIIFPRRGFHLGFIFFFFISVKIASFRSPKTSSAHWNLISCAFYETNRTRKGAAPL